MSDSILEWHKDGHNLSLRIEDSELVIRTLPCPNRAKEDAACIMHGVCLFEYHVGAFGLDCNVGSAEPHPVMEFAWAWQGPSNDIDGGQLWIIPVEDPTFASWSAQYEI